MEKGHKMCANKLDSFYNIHPGDILKDEIEFRGISQRKLATEIGVAYSQLNEVLNAKRPLTTQMAMLLATALDLDAEPLLTIQTQYDILEAKRNPNFMTRLKNIANISSLRRVAAIL